MKGHWPSGKRRHPEPPDWRRIRAALDEAAKHRQGRLVASKIGVHVDTVRRWRQGEDVPSPAYLADTIAALYALKLYFVRGR